METALHCEQRAEIRKYAKLNDNKGKVCCATDQA